MAEIPSYVVGIFRVLGQCRMALVAQRNDGVEVLVGYVVEPTRLQFDRTAEQSGDPPGDVQRYCRRLDSRARHFDSAAADLPGQGFGELRSDRVVTADVKQSVGRLSVLQRSLDSFVR